MMVALLALFVALGGSSYAALKVTGKNVTDGTLSSADLKNNSVTTIDIRDGSLLEKDFRAGQLPVGAQGPKGDTGAQGPSGLTGARGPSDAFTAFFGDKDIPAAAGQPFTLAELDLAAGDYLVFANAGVTDLGGGGAYSFGCVLLEAGDSPDNAADTATVALSDLAVQTVTLTGAFSLAGPSTVTVGCLKSGSTSGSGSRFKDIDIGAVQVGALH
jgi:hypothetical protein